MRNFWLNTRMRRLMIANVLLVALAALATTPRARSRSPCASLLSTKVTPVFFSSCVAHDDRAIHVTAMITSYAM